MSQFDAAGGPWGYRLRSNLLDKGIDVYIEAGTFTGQTVPRLQGTIPDQTIYAGAMADSETYLVRHNWFNQGAHYRATVANYPGYPGVTVVDYYHLVALASFLPELVVQVGGAVDLAALLPLLENTAITGNEYYRRALLALLSGCAVTAAQRTQLATALSLDPAAASILATHGVLLDAYVGAWTTADYTTINQTLALMPDPVKDELHLVVLDEAMPAAGGYGSGGIITLNEHGGTAGGFAPYPSGRQLPGLADHLQGTLVHEIGHMRDSSSVGFEANRWETIYAAGATDANAFLYGAVYPLSTEDIIFYWLGYCTDSATILAEVAARGNAVLTQKLSHAIDLLPSVLPGTVPFFTTDPTTHVTSVSLAPATRGPGANLGDDGMITSVNGVAF